MNRAVLLAAASVLALSTTGASAGLDSPTSASFGVKALQPLVVSKSKTLYNQNSDDGGVGINSQIFESSLAQDDSQGADDFTVPKGKSWTITEVDVTGVYYNGPGPAKSEDVKFYKKGKNGIPGRAVTGGKFIHLKGIDNGGSFSIMLPKKGITLKAGSYWVSVQANLGGVGDGGEWGWDVNNTQHGNLSVWQNYGGGDDKCPTWGTTEICQGSGPDYMFDLKGSQKK